MPEIYADEYNALLAYQAKVSEKKNLIRLSKRHKRHLMN
jgi:hypothetical protein